MGCSVLLKLRRCPFSKIKMGPGPTSHMFDEAMGISLGPKLRERGNDKGIDGLACHSAQVQDFNKGWT